MKFIYTRMELVACDTIGTLLKHCEETLKQWTLKCGVNIGVRERENQLCFL